MRIIDKNGKLFGLINIFDLLVIAIIFGVGMPVVTFQLREKTALPPKHSHIYKEVIARAYAVNEVADRVKKGNYTKCLDGHIAGEIIEINSNTPVTLEGSEENARITLSTEEEKSHTLITQDKEQTIDGGMLYNREVDILLHKRAQKWSSEIQSLKAVEARVNLLCKIDKYGDLIINLSNSPLTIGSCFIFKTEDYVILFYIIEI